MMLLKEILRVLGKAIELGLSVLAARTLGVPASMHLTAMFDLLRHSRRPAPHAINRSNLPTPKPAA